MKQKISYKETQKHIHLHAFLLEKESDHENKKKMAQIQSNSHTELSYEEFKELYDENEFTDEQLQDLYNKAKKRRK